MTDPNVADGSVQELADTGRPHEAEVIDGGEGAADHAGRPVPSRATYEERIWFSDWSAGLSSRTTS
jgi:hypothetical protein